MNYLGLNWQNRLLIMAVCVSFLVPMPVLSVTESHIGRLSNHAIMPEGSVFRSAFEGTKRGVANVVSESAITTNLEITEFEGYLENRFHGSYLIYKQLSEHNRVEIYNMYLEGKDIKDIRKEIINKYLE